MDKSKQLGYSYTGLDPARREIRLLQLQPSILPKARVKCDIFHVFLDDKPEYLALSYVWGSKENQGTIQLESKDMLVNRNLLEALQGVRRKTTAFVIWVDALCINQQNLNERNSQVTLMGQLYAQAQEVLVWLGPRRDGSELAVDMLRRWSAFVVPEGINGPKETVTAFRKASSSFNPHVWTALYDLLRREWWKRIWVYQEFVLAQQPTIICGLDRLRWRELYAAITLWKYIQGDTFLHLFKNEEMEAIRGCPFDAAWQITSHRWSKAKQTNSRSNPAEKLDLIHLVNMLRTHDATDPKDKIYALMGVAESSHHYIAVDYQKPLETIYTEYLMAVICEQQSLTILAETFKSDKIVDADVHLPSFVPDWRNTQKITHQLSSSWYPSGNHRAKYKISEDFRQLDITGYNFDSIAKICDSTARDDDNAMLDWRDFAMTSTSGTYSTKESPHWVLYNAMIARVRPSNPPSSQNNESRLMFLAGFMSKAGKAAVKTGRTSGNYKQQEKQIEALKLKTDCVALFPAWTGDIPETLTEMNEDSILEPMAEAFDRNNKRDKWIQINGTLSRYSCARIFASRFNEVRARRRLVITSKGYLGLVPETAQVGDQITLIHGCNLPLLIRKMDDHYKLIGGCYIYGVMSAEMGGEARYASDVFQLR